jgi:hypothetical protein
MIGVVVLKGQNSAGAGVPRPTRASLLLTQHRSKLSLHWFILLIERFIATKIITENSP